MRVYDIYKKSQAPKENFAILNYWHEDEYPVYVTKGMKIIGHSSGEEFNLTEDKEYEILDVHSYSEVSVENDLGEIEIYSIENFKSYLLRKENQYE